MEVLVKYFKFLDPETGGDSKIIGWVTKFSSRNVTVRNISGIATVIKEEPVEAENPHIPRVAGLLEISKEIYDALDTGKESKYSAVNRSKWESSLAFFQDYAAKYVAPKDVAKSLQLKAQAFIDG